MSEAITVILGAGRSFLGCKYGIKIPVNLGATTKIKQCADVIQSLIYLRAMPRFRNYLKHINVANPTSSDTCRSTVSTHKGAQAISATSIAQGPSH